MHIVVLITAKNKKEAKAIAQALLKNKLAACVNISRCLDSLFWWRGKIDKACECLLFVKSIKSNLSKIIKLVKRLHSYEVPEIIALPVVGGNKTYLNWINDSLR